MTSQGEHNFLGYNLRGNPPEAQVTSGQKLITNVIYLVLLTSMQLF